jgi:hypothetical protein
MLTQEDKQLIAEYMWWAQYKYPSYYLNTKGDIESHHFDLNDAGLVVQEMQKRGDWEYFVGDTEDKLIYTRYHKEHHSYKSFLVAWLFNAENFFNAMAEWIKEGKK